MGRIQLVVVALLVAFVVEHTPWKLLALVSEALCLHPTQIHTRPTDNDGYWPALTVEARLIGLGWQVAYTDLVATQGAYGLMDPATRLIQVDKNLAWTDRHCTLAHEGGHVLAPTYLSHEQNEVFAEMVGALACDDGLLEHARYLSGDKLDMLAVALTHASALYRAADFLEDR